MYRVVSEYMSLYTSRHPCPNVGLCAGLRRYILDNEKKTGIRFRVQTLLKVEGCKVMCFLRRTLPEKNT